MAIRNFGTDVEVSFRIVLANGMQISIKTCLPKLLKFHAKPFKKARKLFRSVTLINNFSELPKYLMPSIRPVKKIDVKQQISLMFPFRSHPHCAFRWLRSTLVRASIEPESSPALILKCVCQPSWTATTCFGRARQFWLWGVLVNSSWVEFDFVFSSI